MDIKDINNIPQDKFQFANQDDLSREKKLSTKPVGYFQDAFRRFSKNKGAVVASIIIIILVLFAIIVPFCTPYTVAYSDTRFTTTRPKNKLFENTNFWDGCEYKEQGKANFYYYYAMGLESGHNAVKNQSYTITDDGLYGYRQDTYHKNGMIYQNLSLEEYQAIQEYQNRTGRQVIYPTVRPEDRPKAQQDNGDANYYYKTTGENRTNIVYDKNGDIIPVYWTYIKGSNEKGFVDPNDNYNSQRIKGDGYTVDGVTYYYSYARTVSSGVECRVNYYEYYIWKHTEVYKDGITEPLFLFGTTGEGKDILTCLSSGARFSFIFAILVAVVNLLVGAIYGSIAGYFGGKVDLVMERISDILGAIPMMIVITLLKLHMQAPQAIILFLTFFFTGWIGMAATTRMQFYRYKNQEYVLASRTLGANNFRLMFKHIFPNAIGTLITACALVIPSMIYSETNLSYLGIINLESGNITSVGTLIAAGQTSLQNAPFVALFPSLFLALLMLSFNLFGNGLRDAFNPSLRGSEG